jgi:very-short-patch-repair endonuclease
MHASLMRALDVAAEQSGVLSRAQARAFGLSDRMIDGGLADGLFVALWSGVYRVRGAPQTEAMAVTAAALAARGRASDATAARLMQLDLPLPDAPVHVTAETASRHRRVWRIPVEAQDRAFFPVTVHRFQSVGEPTVVVDGIPCTDAARVLIDIAPRLSLDDLEDGFERARRLGLVSTDVLARRFELIGGRGRPGTPKVRALLANARPSPLESKLEGKAWRMLRASRLPEPVRQLRVDLQSGRWFRLDFAWPELLVAFETEGFEWHGSRARWKRDRTRVAALERLGWRIVVATWDDVARQPAETLDRLARALAERRLLVRST